MVEKVPISLGHPVNALSLLKIRDFDDDKNVIIGIICHRLHSPVSVCHVAFSLTLEAPTVIRHLELFATLPSFFST